MSRQTIDGASVEEHERIIALSIHTHVPDKWLFVDLETGDVWKHDPRPSRIWARYGKAQVDGKRMIVEKA